MQHMKPRGPVFAALLSLTGIYVLYWLYSVGKELAKARGEKYSPGLWLIVSIFTGGLGLIYMIYRTAKMASDFAQKGSTWVYFLLLWVPVSNWRIPGPEPRK